MKKSDFVRAVATKAEFSQKDVRELLSVIGDVIIEAMKDDEGVKPFEGFTFSTRHRDARKGRNPQTGEEIMIAAKDVPVCKFGKVVKEAVA